MRGERTRLGARIAELLAGSWRDSPPPSNLDAAALGELVPLLLRGGAAALASRRVDGASASATIQLKQAWRLQSLRAELHAQRLSRTMKALARAGVTALLGKGFAIARLYPDVGLRPYGDLDLYVAPDELARARAALADVEAAVDLHAGFGEIGDAAEVLARAQSIELDGAQVRLFGDEDHLRLLAVHLLRHGAWRPLWLCDLAVAVERAPAPLDWGYLLGGDRRRANWIGSALALARDLLGARIEAPADPLPRWLVPTVLAQWGDAGFVPQGARTPMAQLLARPRAMVAALRQRWPNAIEATVGVGARFDESARLPLQLAECARRVATFSRTLRAAAVTEA
jgi:hypothetical protein